MSGKGPKEAISPFSFEDNEFIIKKKFLSLGNEYYVKDSEGNNIAFCQEKSLSIKGELRLFRTKDKTDELFRIKQRNILDFTGTFQVFESGTENTLGFLKRNWAKSMVLGEWKIFDENREVVAEAEEDSLVKEVIRFKGLKRLPYRYKLYRDGKKIGVCKQRVSLLKKMYRLQIDDDLEDKLDSRLFISLALLLDAVERKFKKIGK
ncbi:MAG: LURP-one-related family protein [Candidatus Thermoplasmatota archaeon]|nr:LURP-one-related family protein [Candidatus Thermoplasmatota archaeon]MBS3789805.1 LURP-one-related family protein [Candidatus Thermoplasmatota archaeon]